ncbi:hypothetical protein OIU74_007489 [Salix koriyanagi]|uniref:Uncharacterized protein n=1 Tax=Salix koriyanagi TaxID=2511006 RepID=A0A9Q0Z658_9ROSI|nr:hypothetical protein OIU74_007489 [Salix koriyanagi]
MIMGCGFLLFSRKIKTKIKNLLSATARSFDPTATFSSSSAAGGGGTIAFSSATSLLLSTGAGATGVSVSTLFTSCSAISFPLQLPLQL